MMVSEETAHHKRHELNLSYWVKMLSGMCHGVTVNVKGLTACIYESKSQGTIGVPRGPHEHTRHGVSQKHRQQFLTALPPNHIMCSNCEDRGCKTV